MISIICPVYNEEDIIEDTIETICRVMSSYDGSCEILCIDDGSTDSTLTKLILLKSRYSNLRIIEFSRNFGKEIALTAGLSRAKGDAIIPIDADLQDPPELILDMIAKWKVGFKVVLAKRVDRSKDSKFKKYSAIGFYKVHNTLSQSKVPENVGDFRLMDRVVVDAINLLPERQRFMKGLFSWVGFKTTVIEYSRPERKAGKSKFNAWKLWNFAIEGITGFSTVPLKVWSYLGAFISFISFLYGAYIVFKTLLFGVDVPGYASILVAVLFLGGTQLIGIGVLGEYIGRIYIETKMRPLYIISNEY
ncbi:glycosyltransferase family 2 protein [Shewanella sp. KX20019]|uniref:glycosyltransferase family 2 protein n=1 Tax=Shewanella sp. KX20019 TaxID=2803864 RepID=UPI001927817F|nr:glycosyltransferase family 2 protein [Shewanella sp. KX20019]QQX82295.1 glycosyltransferase family 2 protein [Shewanella sp. KX20019]